jgi:hypothetical protein
MSRISTWKEVVSIDYPKNMPDPSGFMDLIQRCPTIHSSNMSESTIALTGRPHDGSKFMLSWRGALTGNYTHVSGKTDDPVDPYSFTYGIGMEASDGHEAYLRLMMNRWIGIDSIRREVFMTFNLLNLAVIKGLEHKPAGAMMAVNRYLMIEMDLQASLPDVKL